MVIKCLKHLDWKPAHDREGNWWVAKEMNKDKMKDSKFVVDASQIVPADELTKHAKEGYGKL